MKLLTVFFTLMFVVAVAACIVCGYYADIQPVLGEAVKPLIYISVGFGIVMVGLDRKSVV